MAFLKEEFLFFIAIVNLKANFAVVHHLVKAMDKSSLLRMPTLDSPRDIMMSGSRPFGLGNKNI